ncbi:MAG: hypothetical protein ACLQBQ_05740 [Smithella sp.]
MQLIRKDIDVILLRFLSIYSLVKAIELFARYSIYLLNPKNQTIIIFIQLMGPAIIMLLCSLVIWNLSPMIALRMSKWPDQDAEDGSSLDDLYNLAFCVLGVYIIVETIPDIITFIGFFSMDSSPNAHNSTAFIALLIRSIGYIVKILLGIWLFLGSRRIVKIITSTRSRKVA